MTDHIEDSPIKMKNRGGRPPNSIWEDINKGEAVGSGKFAASCKYCKNTWSRGEVSKLEEHLSNHCPDAPAAVVRRYMTKVMERQDKSKSSKKRKYSKGQSNMDDYYDSTELNEQRCTRINCALVKFFIACGIAFRVVEHPFFINFIKELNAGYNTPTREVLVNQLLERELAQVNFKVNSELEKETNLTLAFDGWTSGTHRSIWNFIVMTPSRKEYLYQLSDLSENSHTAEYLVTVIEKVIEGIGEDRICAVVSDNAANVRNARKIIHENHPKIENVRCVAHSINLIACDIVKEKFGERLLKRVNILTTFFRSSHQANAKLAQIIKEKGISGGGLKLYCKTRWTTASESVNSVINLESALEEMASDHDKVLTNDKIKPIIQSRNFFSNLRVLGFVLDPLRKAVLSLESRRATLADCFLSLARLAATLKKLPKSLNPAFRSHCIKVINERFDEFDDDKYITCFFMDPRFRNAPLKKCALMRIIKCAASIGKNLGFDRYEAETLCDQIQKYINEQEPFDLDIGFAKDNPVNWWKYINTEPEPDVLPRIASYLFAICPNSATCERGFSTLGWLFHKHRLNLNVDKLESMCKLILYWKSNSKTELGFYGIDQKKNTRLSDDEINIRIAEAFAEDDDEEYNEEQASTQRLTTSGETIPEDNCRVVIESLWIDQFVNLSHDSITSEIGDIPRDILDDSDENNAEDDKVDDSGNNKRPREGDYDYDIDDVLGMDDGDNNDDNYDDNEE
ncbi:ribonuclease H-like domain-containing protein [Rhizophagus irregularis DAOM 181602=DAOM 197198]|nr:ribonuclease H-like domain-containing protein [Rhizophagus irregularis DAOM 181602=DAOM 197198]